jgi:hypothetical protein
MSIEKRRAPRSSIILDIQWVTNGALQPGTISDISVNGCFILASGLAKPGEPVWINVRAPYGEHSVMFGEIVYNVPDIGFAVQFVKFGDEETRFLNYLINYFETEEKLRP